MWKTVMNFALLTMVCSTPVALAGSQKSDPGRGARVYSENCGRCHNTRPVSQFNDRNWSTIVTHMRVVAGLPGQQARDVEAFLRASNNPPREVASSVGRALQQSGEALLDRYGCRGCHTIAGKGGTIAPNLDAALQRHDEAWVRDQIRNPRSHNARTIMPVVGASPAEIDQILEFLRQQLGTGEGRTQQ